MAEDIGKVSFGIEANFDDKGMKQAEQGLAGLQRAGNSAAKGISAFGVAAGTAGGIVAVGLVKALGQSALKIATFAFTTTEAASSVVESFDKMAQATGVSVRHFQQLEPVMRKNGVSAEQMGTMFGLLARRIHEARDPSSLAGQAFESLGLSLTGLESPSEVLTLIADRVSKLPDGFEKTRLIMELLGRSGSQLTSVLNEGAAGFKKSAEEAAKMANVLSDDANKALLDVNDTFDVLELAQDNLSKHLAVLFAPMVTATNEARIAVLRLATVFTDDMTIATRTLAVRLEALFGFLKAQAQLSITEIAKVPEIYARWSHWAEEQIIAIRKQSITTKELGDTIGTVDAKAQAAARAQAKADEQRSFGLMQMEIGWKIVQPLIDGYRRSQEALGKYITTTLISAYQELQQASALWAKTDFEAANRNIDQMKAMEAQYRATAEASNRAALASGGITPMQFEERSGASTLGAIDQEIAAQQQRIAALNTFYEQKLALTMDDANAQRELIHQHIAEVATVNNAIAVLEQQRVTQGVVNAAAMTQANTKAYQDDLAARAATAQAEVGILQASFAETDVLRDAQLNAIDARLAHELSAVGQTEAQITAIRRRAEAERINIARQFPTFWEKQLQDLQASNVFSMGQLVSTWSSGMANTIVNAQNFGQSMVALGKQTATAMLQGVIQFGIQQLALVALQATAETTIAGTTAAAVVGINTAKTTAIIAGETVAAGATVSIWAGAGAAIVGLFGTITGAVVGLISGTIIPALVSAGTAVMTFLSGIASALDASIFGAPFSIPVWAAVGLVGAAIGLIAAWQFGAFAKGGIVTGPTLGMIGEAGSSEAVIPLNNQGAGFMADMLGLGSGYGSQPQQIVTKVYLDKRQIAIAVSDELPSALRRMGVPA